MLRCFSGAWVYTKIFANTCMHTCASCTAVAARLTKESSMLLVGSSLTGRGLCLLFLLPFHQLALPKWEQRRWDSHESQWLGRKKGMTVCVDCCPRPRPPVPSDSVSVVDAMQRSIAMERLWGISVCSGAMEDKSRETGREWSRCLSRRFTLKRTTWLQPRLEHLKRAPLIIKPWVN